MRVNEVTNLTVKFLRKILEDTWHLKKHLNELLVSLHNVMSISVSSSKLLDFHWSRVVLLIPLCLVFVDIYSEAKGGKCGVCL